MHLVDKGSNEFADLTFHGVLSGPTNLGLQNEFKAPVAATATLGGNVYGVIIGLYTPPGATGSGVKGVLATNVLVTPGSGTPNPSPPPVSQVPEPGTLSLAGTGGVAILTLLMLRRRFARRPVIVGSPV
jgi:hypothetical protein